MFPLGVAAGLFRDKKNNGAGGMGEEYHRVQF
jgi:hypothetical protein